MEARAAGTVVRLNTNATFHANFIKASAEVSFCELAIVVTPAEEDEGKETTMVLFINGYYYSLMSIFFEYKKK